MTIRDALDAEWQECGNFTKRLKVPGGWLVKTAVLYDGAAVAMVFLPDPSHAWKLGMEEKKEKVQ